MNNEELVKANESLAALLRETLSQLEKVTAERDTAAATAKAFAKKLAGEHSNKHKLPPDARIYVLALADSELSEIWHSTDKILEIEYRDNGSMPINPKYRWELVLWDYNGDDNVLASGPTKEGLQAIEPHIRETWHRAMQVMWRRLNRDLWPDW